MARRILDGAFKDQNGCGVASGTVTVYLAGTTTLAIIYSAISGGSAVSGSALTTDSKGYWYCYVDETDYGSSQRFKVSLSKQGYATTSYDYIRVYTTPPALTAAEIAAISSPSAGDWAYDSTNNKLVFYNGSAWETVTSST